MNEICIAGRHIGPNHPPYIIAEISSNHNGRLDQALAIIKAAKEAGADAVKIQTYTPDTMTINSYQEDFKLRGGLWDGYTLYDLYDKAQTPFEWHQTLFDYAHKIGITIFSSPFDESAVDLLENLHTPAYKIASFEIIDLPLIAYAAKTRKPMIISIGLANENEINEAIKTAYKYGAKELALLHCISGYPTPLEQANLVKIPSIQKHFNTIVGFSDHTTGTTAAVASVALGACLIEKHFTLNRNNSPDSAFSIDPRELSRLCQEAKGVWQSLGSATYKSQNSEKGNIQFRRSIYAVESIKKEGIFTIKNIRRIRPGMGLAPKFYDEILGKRATQDIQRGEPLNIKMIANRKTQDVEKENILFLGLANSPLLAWLRSKNETVIQTDKKLTMDFIDRNQITFLISYNYQYIIKKHILDKLPNKAINLHISYLPWNRGADPNFWSFIDNTPKGVTIHYLDKGIDTGDIICQKELVFNLSEATLASTYQQLQSEIQELFKQSWDSIKLEKCPRIKQSGKGSFHNQEDKLRFSYLLTDGWNTPVSNITAPD